MYSKTKHKSNENNLYKYYENKETVQSKSFCLHKTGFLKNK